MADAGLGATPTQAALLAQSWKPVTLPAPGKPWFQNFPSFHKGVLFVEGFWLFLKRSLILSFKTHFVGLEHCRVFFLPLHPDVSGSQDVHL